MALIEWTENFSVKIKEIDDQHKMLVSLINSLHQALVDGEGNNHVEEIISGLVEYTENHFKTEENFFEEFDYPEKDAHKQEHIDFVRKVSIFKTEFENKEVMLTIEVLEFLSSWLQDHILGEDMKYSGFLVEKGLS